MRSQPEYDFISHVVTKPAKDIPQVLKNLEKYEN